MTRIENFQKTQILAYSTVDQPNNEETTQKVAQETLEKTSETQSKAVDDLVWEKLKELQSKIAKIDLSDARQRFEALFKTCESFNQFLRSGISHEELCQGVKEYTESFSGAAKEFVSDLEKKTLKAIIDLATSALDQPEEKPSAQNPLAPPVQGSIAAEGPLTQSKLPIPESVLAFRQSTEALSASILHRLTVGLERSLSEQEKQEILSEIHLLIDLHQSMEQAIPVEWAEGARFRGLIRRDIDELKGAKEACERIPTNNSAQFQIAAEPNEKSDVPLTSQVEELQQEPTDQPLVPRNNASEEEVTRIIEEILLGKENSKISSDKKDRL